VATLRARLTSPLSSARKLAGRVRRRVVGTATYRSNRREFSRLRDGSPNAAEFPFGPPFPCLNDRYSAGGVARGQYFHQDLLVAQWIFAENPERHLDVGSRIDGFVAHVASFRAVEVLELRPVHTSAAQITFHQRDIMATEPAWDASCDSLSCLHTIEHFGLGRYGDTLNPEGWRVGWENLVRMARPGGTVYLSTMIGPQRIEFDAHRIFAVPTLVALVADTCTIESVAYVDDAGELHLDADPHGADAARSFGCRSGCVIMKLRRR
jgi:hypothetical protein